MGKTNGKSASAENMSLPTRTSCNSFLCKNKSPIKTRRTSIPENDIWLAACAMAYNLTIVTADKHFSFIKGLSLENR